MIRWLEQRDVPLNNIETETKLVLRLVEAEGSNFEKAGFTIAEGEVDLKQLHYTRPLLGQRTKTLHTKCLAKPMPIAKEQLDGEFSL